MQKKGDAGVIITHYKISLQEKIYIKSTIFLI